MKPLSIDQAWTETSRFVAREGRLLIPVALAFIALPVALVQAVAPAAVPGKPPEAGLWSILLGPALVAVVIGTLAISVLALRPGLSVREALGEAVRRAPRMLGAAFLLLLILFAALLPLAVLMVMIVPAETPGGLTVSSLLLMVPLIILSVRFMLLNPIAASETGGPLALIRRSWALTRGHTWRLFGFVMLVTIAFLILVVAVSAVVGIVVALLGGSAAPGTIGASVILLVSALVNGLFSMLFAVAAARIYRQLEGGLTSGI